VPGASSDLQTLHERPGMGRQLVLLFDRAVKCYWRDPRYNTVRIVITAILYVHVCGQRVGSPCDWFEGQSSSSLSSVS
jgi:hypothetical protein